MAAVESYRELVKAGFPARYPLVQFPNPPLLIAIAASIVGWFVSGNAQDAATAVGTMGMTVWAYQEAVQGVNGFRHALGVAVLISTAVSLAQRIH